MAGFLSVFVFFGLTGAEWWPLTGWKLFSRVRTEYQSGWEVRVVDGSAQERPLDFAELPRGFHGALHVLGGFATLSALQQQAVCRTWLGGAQRLSAEATGVRLYRTRTHMSRYPTVVGRRLVHACGEGRP